MQVVHPNYLKNFCIITPNRNPKVLIIGSVSVCAITYLLNLEHIFSKNSNRILPASIINHKLLE